MDVYNLSEGVETFVDRIKEGEVFVYPTDTVYGLGCLATDYGAVERIRELKIRPDGPLLVLVPSVDWVFGCCEVPNHYRGSMRELLPGAYSFVVQRKNSSVENPYQDALAENVSFDDKLGVRVIDHPFMEIFRYLDEPIITTSANLKGQPTLISLDDIPHALKTSVDFFVDAGVLEGKSSTLIDTISGKTLRS